MLFLERDHRKILWTIQGLPVRCSSSTLTALACIQSIKDSIKQQKLGFVASTANLPADSLARKILVARARVENSKGVIRT